MRITTTLLLGSLLLFPTIAQDANAQNRVIRPGTVNSRHEELKQQADDAYRQGDYAKTIELATQVLQSAASDHVALYLRGSARVEIGIQQRNADLLREGIGDAREAIRIRNRMEIDYYLPYLYGMTHLTAIEGKPSHAEIAKDVASQILEMDSVTAPEKANIAYQLALIENQLQSPQGALDALARALDYDPAHLAAHLARTDILSQTGQPEDVEKAFTATVAQFPEEPLVFNNRGMYLQSLGRYDEAIADFNRAIELNKNFVPAYTNRAFARLQQGQFSEALADLSQSLEINPQQPAAYSLRGSANLSTGDVQAAIEDYQTALKFDENSPALRADVGFAKFFAGKYEEALQAFDSTLEVDPQAEFLNPWRAAALLHLDRREAAEQTFRPIVEKPQAERTWYDMLTLLLLEKVSDNDVLSVISGADPQREDGQKCEAFYFIGQRWLLDGKEEDARTYFRQALESKSQHLSAYRGAQFALNDFGPEA